MYLINYLDRFPNDKECVRYFRELRDIKGFVCNKCNGHTHSWNEHNFSFSCHQCGKTTGLREGTIMEGSSLPLKYWFLCIYLLTFPENPYSIEEVRSKLDYLNEEAIDDMLKKLENLMLDSKIRKNFDTLLYSTTGR
jgi:hypothetical protein